MDLVDQTALSLAKEAQLIERIFAANNYYGNLAESEFIDIKGDIPILLSAPHAVKHPRNRFIKSADAYTGTIALQLAKLTGASVLIHAQTTDEDPNYDQDGPYKQRLEQLIKQWNVLFVLDIHGMSEKRSTDFALGTNYGKTLGQRKSLLTTLVEALHEAGFAEVDDAPRLFSATHADTIARFVWGKVAVPSLQLEINKRYRSPARAPQDYISMLLALSNALYAIKALL